MDFFKCQLCGKLFDIDAHTPRMMPDCGHTFCQSCISERIKQGAVICPEDDSIYQNQTSIEDFPVNTTLVQILKKRISSNKTAYTQQPSRSFIKPTKEVNPFTIELNKEPETQEAFRRKSSLLNKSFDATPTWKKDEEDELKKLLTPTDFLKNLLGSMHNQFVVSNPQQDSKRQSKDSWSSVVKQSEPSSSYRSNEVKSSVPTQRSIEQTINNFHIATPEKPPINKAIEVAKPQQSQINISKQSIDAIVDRLEVLVSERETEFREKINQKFEEVIKKLKDRQVQVQSEAHRIYERIYQGFSLIVQQKQVHDEDKFIDCLQKQIDEVHKKISVEYQLQLELIVPRYCIIRSPLDNEDFKFQVDSPRVQSTVSFANGHNAKQPSEVESIRPESDFMTFENEKYQLPLPKPQNFSIPMDITNKQPTTLQKWTTPKQVSPPKRIFEPQPTSSPLVKIKPNLFSTPLKQQTPELASYLEQVVSKLQRGINIELINLKDQSNISDYDLHGLVEQLKVTTSYVRTIKLSRNLITNQGFYQLLMGIRKNRTVKTLNLKRNNLDENCLQLILKEYSTQKHNYLSQLYLKGNHIDSTKQSMDLNLIQQLGIVIYL